MRQRWKKVITCLGCRADVCFLRSLLFVRNQLHTKNTYTHTRIHTRHITFFSSFLRAFFFSHFVCLSLFFLLLFYLILFACPGGAWMHTLYTLYEPYARTHTNTSQTQCSMHMHVALHSLILFPTNPQYHRSRWSCIKSIKSTATLRAVIAAATVCRCRCNPQHSRMVYCNLWIQMDFRTLKNPMNLFVGWLVRFFLPDFLQMPAPFFSDSYNNTQRTIFVPKHIAILYRFGDFSCYKIQ